VTLQTIADRVGVSRMTVSNAFSRPDQLSPTLRQRILAAAEDLGYVGPDPSARALAKGTTATVGVVLTDSLGYAFNDLVATQFLGAITEELAPTGLALTLLTSSETGDIIPARDVAMDGALVFSCEPQSPAVSWLRQRRLPMVFIDQNPVDGIPSVNVADREGARQAAQHLIDLGHRRIGLMLSGTTGPYGVIEDLGQLVLGYPQRERLLGWTDALRSAGITPLLVRQRGDGSQHGPADQLMLDRDDHPTAVLCFSDVLAFHLIQSAADRGLQVPQDLSVIGFDDHPLASQFRPALTTVRQDTSKKGSAAAAALTAALGRAPAGTRPPDEHVVLPTELVVRESTAPPRA
jgi:DNA-binding LacI/PurR family transcriptional regulator